MSSSEILIYQNQEGNIKISYSIRGRKGLAYT